jgi:hypothetical protein
VASSATIAIAANLTAASTAISKRTVEASAI